MFVGSIAPLNRSKLRANGVFDLIEVLEWIRNHVKASPIIGSSSRMRCVWVCRKVDREKACIHVYIAVYVGDLRVWPFLCLPWFGWVHNQSCSHTSHLILELRAASIEQAPNTVPVRSFDKTIHLLHSPIFCLLGTHFRISPVTSMLPSV